MAPAIELFGMKIYVFPLILLFAIFVCLLVYIVNEKYDIRYISTFILWLNTGKYQEENPIKVEGYSAHDIVELANFLDGAGVFNFLITLRERPEKAKGYIKDGFKIK
ncbi:MAG TPA: hypothetical protein DDZ89_05285 [Clostridiales bacterium]|nr:hypothetical protein [Clostridiales bacterium]